MTTKKPLFIQAQGDTVVTPFFKFKEIACPCCGLVVYDSFALRQLSYFRQVVGAPVVVTSGSRCVKHNRQVGGDVNSGHLKGHCFDVVVPEGQGETWQLKARASGFSRTILYPNDGHLHIGV